MIKDTIELEVAAAMANLAESGAALAAATGDEGFARLLKNMELRVARINASTTVEEIQAIVSLADAAEAHADRIAVKVEA